MNRWKPSSYGAFGLVASTLAPGLAWGRPRAASQNGDLTSIERIVIHPAIGVARVGNSPDEWFLGPEVPGPHPIPEGGFKDSAGRIKRQASRFRLYGLDGDGQVVAELTAAVAEIQWRVHLANSKASWYNFDVALDVPSAKGLPPAPLQDAPPPTRSLRRNGSIVARDGLCIDPGPRTISGAGANADSQDHSSRFDGGTFLGAEVPLGELRTDGDGRLLVLGGLGRSGPAIPGAIAVTFANNDLWYDDTSDGPVDATVHIDGREIPVTGAWVVVAPPNYAPGIQSVVTMYDVMFQVATQLEADLRPSRPSFTRMIYPLFERMVQNQWVNAGFLHDFGWRSSGDFLAPDVLRVLASPSDEHAFQRRQVFDRFRDPSFLTMDYSDLPPYYGDDVALPANNPRQWMAVLQIQYGWLRQWAEGDFEADWPEEGLTFPARLEALSLAEQPDALDRAVLDECLGGPFHPGCEMTWPMRHKLLYDAPFRLRRRTSPEPDWGPEMTSVIALAEDGPLSASEPGDITRWMAVPWQTDTSSCLSRYKRDISGYLPAFWPARVPNDVLDDNAYQQILDSTLRLEERQLAFETRVKWLRDLPGFGVSSKQRINAFIRQWHDAGVVTLKPGPSDDAPFPESFWVELGHALFNDAADYPTIDLPVRPTAGDLAGPSYSEVPEPES